MRILLVHNKYKHAGGEDSVVRQESELLVSYGHSVEQLIYDNSVIKTPLEKLISGLKTIYSPASAKRIKARILAFQPDIIHVHNFLPLVSPAVFIVAKKFGIPTVLTLHNYRLICPSATLFYNGEIYEKSINTVFPWSAIWKGVYRNSKLQTAVVVLMIAVHHFLGTWKYSIGSYIALTHFAKEKFEHAALSIPEEKLFVKPNFVQDHSSGDQYRSDYFLFIGRLTEEKGIRTVLKAASLYHIKLVIIGDGPLRSLVEEYAKFNSTISYVGFLPREAVINYLKKCKALIFPSIWYEGFPVTITEAFSTGTPVIASNLGGMKEIIQDKVNGLLFEPGNEKDLILSIIEIVTNDKLVRIISENARTCYLAYYTPSVNYSQLTTIYKNTIQRNTKVSKVKHKQLIPT